MWIECERILHFYICSETMTSKYSGNSDFSEKINFHNFETSEKQKDFFFLHLETLDIFDAMRLLLHNAVVQEFSI